MRALLIGRKLIGDLAPAWPLEILFFHGESPEIPSFEKIRVPPAVLKKITGLDDPDSWAAIVHLPEPQSLVKKDYILILDQVSDPGNLGTLWRSALGLGWQGVWLTPGCVDPFNDKALRAAQGAPFRLPYERIMPDQIIEWMKLRSAIIFTADLHGTPLEKCKIRPPLALLLGNEGRGPGEWSAKYSEKITIPMTPLVESLNVASAGAILLYAMRLR